MPANGAAKTGGHARNLIEALLWLRVHRGAESEFHQPFRLVLRNERAHYFFRLGPEAATPHYRRHPRAEPPRIERLVKDVVDPLGQQIGRLGLSSLGCDHDDWHIDQTDHGARGVYDLPPIQNRQLQTHHQCVRRILRQNPQRRSAVVGDLYREARLDQNFVELHPIRFVADGQ